MALEIKIPSPGESISEVELASWFVEDGALVTKNQEVGEIESEKATLPLIAEQAGKFKIVVQEGTTVQVGDVVASIDTSVEVPDNQTDDSDEKPEAPVAVSPPAVPVKQAVSESAQKAESQVKVTPVARQMMEKEGVSVDDILKGLRKITAGDVKSVLQQSTLPATAPQEASRNEDRTKVSQLRKKISERLVAVKNETAMLTTFNEADMSEIMAIRKKHQDKFVEQHGIKIGFMSFFELIFFQ